MVWESVLGLIWAKQNTNEPEPQPAQPTPTGPSPLPLPQREGRKHRDTPYGMENV